MSGGTPEMLSPTGPPTRASKPTDDDAGAALGAPIPDTVDDHGERQSWTPALPNTPAVRALVVDDDPDAAELLGRWLERIGAETVVETQASAALDRIARDPGLDLVVADLQMEGLNGLELCRRVPDLVPDLPVIVVTGHGSVEAATGALRSGAYDFLTKPVDRELLAHTVARAARERRLSVELRRLREQMDQVGASGAGSAGLGALVGSSRTMDRLFDLVRRVATTDASVLITGESGTGKELVAKALHDESDRKQGPFVAINCAAVPASLIESELFGHVRGAFTDARGTREGLFLGADGGTLFLDEIGELPIETQPKLLRALQERRVRPVGGDSERSFDARIIAATNRDLDADVRSGRFREDLYYRVNVVRLELPPLRERGTDVLELAQRFIERYADRHRKPVRTMSDEAAQKLLDYDWPGNVRELENAIDRAVALTRHERLAVADLPVRIQRHRPVTVDLAPEEPESLLPMHEVERRYIDRVLELTGGNKARAARILGFDRRTLYRKLHRFAMETSQPSGEVDAP
jgi:two-component system response regulator HydG